MPYANVPKSLWGKMDRCVAHVKAKGDVSNAYAVCYKSVVGSAVHAAATSRKKGK